MKIRSYDELDFALAWKRVLNWARGGSIDIPDRLPFETQFRIYGDEGRHPLRDHHLSPITVVMSSKKTGTARPLARIDPIDLTLYQALIDRLAADIEAALPGRGTVFAYRQNLDGDHHAFAGSPGRGSMETRVQEIFSAPGDDPFAETPEKWRFAIKTDIAGYYLSVRLDELEHRLYAATAHVNVVRDLLALLRAWQTLGIRGLPQGVRPSSPLGNLYVAPVDKMLADKKLPYVRWMDDWVIASEGFHVAREIQDEMERELFEIGLTLSGEKTKVVRAARAIEESESAKSRLANAKRARQIAFAEFVAEMAMMDYPIDEEDLPAPAELDFEAVAESLDEQLVHLDDDSLPDRFRSMLIEGFRDLASLRRPHALDRIPRILERAPDLTKDITHYLAEISGVALEEVRAVFAVLLENGRFVREHEKLDLCRALLALSPGTAPELSTPMAVWVAQDESELVRARALLAWGAQSPPEDFEVSDRFWAATTTRWRPYALVAIQTKDHEARDARYSNWSGEGRFLGQLAERLRAQPLSWRKI